MGPGSGVGAADYFQIKYCLNTILRLKKETIVLNRQRSAALMFVQFGCVGSAVARDQPADNV